MMFVNSTPLMLTKDDLKRGEKEIQDLTDAYVKKTDDLVAAKEKEIMEI